MRIEVDADAWPVEPRRDLLDVGRFAGTVIALHHDPAIECKARQDRQRGVGIEHIGIVEIGHALIRDRKGRYLHVDVDAKGLAHRNFAVGDGWGCGVTAVDLEFGHGERAYTRARDAAISFVCEVEILVGKELEC